MKERGLFRPAIEILAVVDSGGGRKSLSGRGMGESDCGCDQGSENEVGGVESDCAGATVLCC
jgi:hypothetical protein